MRDQRKVVRTVWYVIGDNLNDAQRAAVRFDGGHLLVLAGPGSGKTRVLTHRIAHLVETGTRPRDILAVTFTNKAAGEIKDRLGLMLPEGQANLLRTGTFHSVCAKILRIENEAAGLRKSFQIFDTSDTEGVLRSIVKQLEPESEAADVTALARELRSQVSLVKNTGRHPDEIDRTGFLATVCETYNAKLNLLGAVDFDDLLVKVRDLLTNDGPVRERWTNRFHHILVDEFQDTNAVQLDILVALAGNAEVTAVGDAAQAIYSWRGADHTVVERFPQLFPGGSIIELGQNYRSTPQIVRTCQAILDAESNSRYRIDLSTTNPDGPPVEIRRFDDGVDEASYIADRIARTHRDTGQAYNQFAVLVRAAWLTRTIEQALSDRGIRAAMVGTVRFFERQEVKDAIAHLRAALFDHDVTAWSRASRTPRRGLGDKARGVVEEAFNASGSVRAAIDALSGSPRKKAEEFSHHLNQVAELAERGPTVAATYIVDHVVGPHYLADKDAADRMANLRELVSAAARFAPTHDGCIEFLEHAALLSSSDVSADDEVSISTIHAAKGREYATVFVVGAEDGTLPHSRSSSLSELREERRLFYVACSRAERELVISYAKKRFVFGSLRDQPPSRFLADLPTDESDVERISGLSRKPSWSNNTRARTVAAGRWADTRVALPREDGPNATRLVRPARGTLPAPSGPRVALEQLSPGCAVIHDAFGPGVVVAVAQSQASATIDFSGKTRTLSVALAPMRLA